MWLINQLRQLKSRYSTYRPTVEVIISRANLLHNLNEFKKMYPGMQFAPVLKSNAYGHGLVQIAQILQTEDIPFITVDSLFEAMTLRAAGVRTKILVIGFTPVENIIGYHYKNISFTLTSLQHVEQAAAHIVRPTQVHIKVDTGMHRQGILPSEISATIDLLVHNKNIIVEGVCSHLANAHNATKELNTAPISTWELAVAEFKSRIPTITYFHLANTAGACFATGASCNVVRLGIGLYGFNTSPHTRMELRPVLRLETTISSIKTISAGDTVGYNNSFAADRTMRIATIPVGYFEVLDRRFSEVGVVSVDGVDCSIVGIISMNITSIDVSHLPYVKFGDRVVVISSNPTDKNCEMAIAKAIGEIPYVLLARIPQHLRRTIE